MTQKVRWQTVIVGLFILSALLTGSIFGAYSFSPTTGQPALYLTANPPAIPAGGVATSTITSTVWDGEYWIWDGPIVNFSTDLGAITASAPIENGTATATLTAGMTTGVATITAVVDMPSIGLLTNTTTVTFEVPIPPLPPNVTTPAVYLTANPSAIPADGVSTSFINATVWDGEYWIWSNPFVNFSTDSGAITESAQIMNGTATATLTAGMTPGVATITAEVTPSEELGLLTNTTTVCFTATAFDTDGGPYPSIAGTYNGTIMPYHPLTVQTLYTYSCEGTGGHTEHVTFYYPNGTLLADASWTGYENDWHNLSFSAPFTLEANVSYNYTLKTGSYPQARHFKKLSLPDGEITCATFTDVNGRVYYDWIPAIKLML